MKILIHTSIIILAFFLDLLLGDPRWSPHPVKAVGFAAKKLEPFFRRIVKREKVAGILFCAAIVLSAYLIVFLLLALSYFLNIYVFLAFSTLLIYTSIALKDLKKHAMAVYRGLERNDIKKARVDLAKIVGRDTFDLDQKQIIKATVETISENLLDGIISPLFYAFIGGAPLAIAFKAASTLDSTVGYKNERYQYFGWASAKLDDILNYIPARLCAILIPTASLLCGKGFRSSFQTALRDGSKSPSPNSGIPEAAMAGALEIRLGGLSYYDHIPAYKEEIGSGPKEMDKANILEAIQICTVASVFFLTAVSFLSAAACFMLNRFLW